MPKKKIGRFWWAVSIRGIIALLLGISTLVGEDFSRIGTFISIYWLTTGISTIMWGWKNARRPVFWISIGLIEVVGGIIALSLIVSGDKIDAARNVIAAAFAVTGLTQILMGIFFKEEVEKFEGPFRSTLLLVLGAVQIVIGLLVVFSGPIVLFKISILLWSLPEGVWLLQQGRRLRRTWRS